MSTLVERLQAKAPELGRRAIAEMYQNPFWQERFGAHGRENADKDGQFHLSYLIQALVASEAGVLTNYARWLQTLLVSRGMCTRHSADSAVSPSVRATASRLGERRSKPASNAPRETVRKRVV